MAFHIWRWKSGKFGMGSWQKECSSASTLLRPQVHNGDGCHPGVHICMPAPIHSPDLALWDYYLFPMITKEHSSRHFDNDDDVITAVDDFLEVKTFTTSTKKRSISSTTAVVSAFVNLGMTLKTEPFRFSIIDSFHLRPLNYQSPLSQRVTNKLRETGLLTD